jgi:hypothetical protein
MSFSNLACLSGLQTGLVRLLAAVGLVTAMGMSPASAALVIGPGTAGSTGTATANDVIFPGFGVDTISGTLGASISETNGGALKYDFIGFEAGFANQFVTPGGTFSNATFGCCIKTSSWLSPLASFGTSGTTGLLNFQFLANGGPANVTNADNGIFFHGVDLPNFFASVNPAAPKDGSIVLWLDDGGGLPTPDADFDDMVIRVSEVSTVPLPASFPLFATGLGLLGLLWVNKRKAEPVNLRAA